MQAERIRRGLTRIELLIVVGIVAVLAALVIPAIQRARDEARRTQMTDNLRQMGVALQSYAGTHTSLPSGTVPRPADPKNQREEQ